MHYSNPVPVMRMLEVIYTEETSQEAVDIMCTVGEAQDKVRRTQPAVIVWGWPAPKSWRQAFAPTMSRCCSGSACVSGSLRPPACGPGLRPRLAAHAI